MTIITHEMNRSYYEQVWRRPRTVNPDRLSRHPRQPLWETMTEKKIITDGARTLELHKLVGNGHNPYILIGYLPNEKLLCTATCTTRRPETILAISRGPTSSHKTCTTTSQTA